MNVKKPNSDDFIFALEALGFEVEDENNEYTVMSDGNYSVHIYHEPDDGQLKKLRITLGEIFSEYEETVESIVSSEDDDELDIDESLDYQDEVRRISTWLNRQNY